MRVLLFRQHAGPEGHIAQIPAGREGIGIPGMPPNVADSVAGTALDAAAGIVFPSPLRLAIVVQPDSPPPPLCVSAPVELRIVLAARTGPVRVERRVPPDPVRMGEVGVLERRPNNRRAAVPQVAFQRLDRRDGLALLYAGDGQERLPARPAYQVSSSGRPSAEATRRCCASSVAKDRLCECGETYKAVATCQRSAPLR